MTTQQFKDFLQAQGCWEGFKANVQFRLNREKLSMDEILEKYAPKGLEYVFFWGCTPEGHDYWAEISRKFKRADKVQ